MLAGVQAFSAGLRRVTFRDAKLDSVNFRGARFTDVAFEDCVLRDVDFGSATLLRVSFAGCTLTGADFTKVSCTEVDLRGASLGITAGFDALARRDHRQRPARVTGPVPSPPPWHHRGGLTVSS